MSPSLSLVASNEMKTQSAKSEPVAARVRRLQTEAKQLARDHIRSLTAAMAEVEKLAAEIAEGGEAYPAGIRDCARRFVEECDARTKTIEVLVSRV
jgi:hypothetical protein